MTDQKPVFRFVGRAVISDDTGYYFARWDRAQKISVLASNRLEANRKAFAMLGESNRRGWSWELRWDRVDEEQGASND